MYVCIYIYIYILSIYTTNNYLSSNSRQQHLSQQYPPPLLKVILAGSKQRDAVRGARWGLEYLDLLRCIWTSELTSQ